MGQHNGRSARESSLTAPNNGVETRIAQYTVLMELKLLVNVFWNKNEESHSF